jgi:hypothetical protein
MRRSLMANELPGGEEFSYRTTDHSQEIAELREKKPYYGIEIHRLVYATCAELLQAHDETGISLDDWEAPRLLIETVLGKPILENGI